MYYSHEENFYWNNVHWLDHVIKKFSVGSQKLIVPLPNQIIELDNEQGADIDVANVEARNFWSEKLDTIQQVTQTKKYICNGA